MSGYDQIPTSFRPRAIRDSRRREQYPAGLYEIGDMAYGLVFPARKNLYKFSSKSACFLYIVQQLIQLAGSFILFYCLSL